MSEFAVHPVAALFPMLEAIDLYELVQDGRRNVDEAIAALDGMQERAKRDADERAERERLEAEASASEEKRKAHERSVELADCIKRGEDSAERCRSLSALGVLEVARGFFGGELCVLVGGILTRDARRQDIQRTQHERSL